MCRMTKKPDGKSFVQVSCKFMQNKIFSKTDIEGKYVMI